MLNLDEKKLENKSICATCGGRCCKKSGCGYMVKDIKSFKFADLKALIDEGNISIKACMKFRYGPDGNVKYTDKVLVLKARSVDKSEVDLFSASSQCKMLTPTGCAYSLEERPSLGGLLIPKPNMGCFPAFDAKEVVEEWAEHQDVLRKLVKHYTGKSVERVYSEQFISAVALSTAKLRLVRGNMDLLEIPDVEVLEAAVEAGDSMKYEQQEASKLADYLVKRFVDKNFTALDNQ